MKFRAIMASVCLCGAVWGVQAQEDWDWSGHLTVAAGQEWNVFHSPETYVDNVGLAWLRDSLVLGGGLWEPRLKLRADRRGEKGVWRSAITADARRYSSLPDANRHGLQWRMSREQDLGKGWQALVAGRLRESQRLGLNILGDELLTSFSFVQAQIDAGLEWQASSALQLAAGMEVFSKRYDRRTTGVSLDQNEWSLETGFEWRPSRVQGKSKLELVGRQRKGSGIRWSGGYEYRDKQYVNWVNEDVLAPTVVATDTTPFLPFDPSRVYPMRRWTYSTWRLRCDLPVGKGWAARLDGRRQARRDRSDGDFGYDDVKLTARAGWRQPKGPWRLALTASRTWRNYTDRLAEQKNGVPYPTLDYRYTRLDGALTRSIGKRAELEMMVDLTARGTNTTAEDRRTRRGYRTGSVLLGYRMQFGP